MRLVGGGRGGETPGNHAMSHKVQHNSCLDPNHCSNLPILLITQSHCCHSIETLQLPLIWEFYPRWVALGVVRCLYWPDIYQAPPGGGFVHMQAYVMRLGDYVMMGVNWQQAGGAPI